MTKIAKNEKLKKLDLNEIKGISGGINVYYARDKDSKKGHYFTLNFKKKLWTEVEL